MPITVLGNDSESVWVKVFTNQTFHNVVDWYHQLGGTNEDFQLLRGQLDRTWAQHKSYKKSSPQFMFW